LTLFSILVRTWSQISPVTVVSLALQKAAKISVSW
jgi:hypothetical protein